MTPLILAGGSLALGLAVVGVWHLTARTYWAARMWLASCPAWSAGSDRRRQERAQAAGRHECGEGILSDPQGHEWDRIRAGLESGTAADEPKEARR